MKKFLCKLFIYALLLLAITIGENILFLYKHSSNDNTLSFNRNDVPYGIQICNFGSSHGYNFNYEDVSNDYVCFRFALGGQALTYDYRILQNYKDRISDGAAVFILISYFSLFGQPEAQLQDFASKNREYYKILRKDLIEHYDMKTDFYVNYLPALAGYDFFSLMKILFSPVHTQNVSTTVTNH